MGYLDFFTANFRNPNTRVAYAVAVRAFFTGLRHEKGGKQHETPARHLLEHFSDAYLTVLRAGAAGERNKGTPLFGTLGGYGRKQLTSARMARRMIVRRAVVAGFTTKLGRHTFRTTGIIVPALNGGPREYAQRTHTTGAA